MGAMGEKRSDGQLKKEPKGSKKMAGKGVRSIEATKEAVPVVLK